LIILFIPFENLDQFILKFGFIYLATKLNVLSSIDATRWKLVFYKIKLNFTMVKVFTIGQNRMMETIGGGKVFNNLIFFTMVLRRRGKRGKNIGVLNKVLFTPF
jgi:hypothetical protein